MHEVLTQIVPCAPPEEPVHRVSGPTIPVDHAILEALEPGPLELREISRAVGDTAHHVFARVQTLVDKGLVEWHRLPDGPRRGPGASVYALVGS